jgi:hypothetical protein
MALLVNSHFAGYVSFELWRVRPSSDLTSRNLQATAAIGYNTETYVDYFSQFEGYLLCHSGINVLKKRI